MSPSSALSTAPSFGASGAAAACGGCACCAEAVVAAAMAVTKHHRRKVRVIWLFFVARQRRPRCCPAVLFFDDEAVGDVVLEDVADVVDCFPPHACRHYLFDVAEPDVWIETALRRFLAQRAHPIRSRVIRGKREQD